MFPIFTPLLSASYLEERRVVLPRVARDRGRVLVWPLLQLRVVDQEHVALVQRAVRQLRRRQVAPLGHAQVLKAGK